MAVYPFKKILRFAQNDDTGQNLNNSHHLKLI